MSYDADEVRNALTEHDHRHILQMCGFAINGTSGGKASDVLGPHTLGEGENGSFSIDLERGLVKDWGSTGYQGDVFDVVMDTRGLTFPEALEWIAEECNLSVQSSDAESAKGPEQRAQNDQSGHSPSSGHSGHSGHELHQKKDEASIPDWDPFRDGCEVAVYEYVDEHGSVVYENVRFEPNPNHPAHGRDKTFRQRAYVPDHEKANDRGFAWGRHGMNTLLYRLPAVREAAREERVVFIVEGEKDVETLEDWGFVATTTGGASSWEDIHAQHLKGARVVILPDNDEKGHDYATTVAKSVHDRTHFVRIVELPGVGLKGDVTDWKELGGTKSLLKALVCQTPNWRPGTSGQRVQNGQSVQSPPFGRSGHGAKQEREDEEEHDPLGLEGLSEIRPRVYDWLPQLLQESASGFTHPHEQDVYLTAALTVISSCLPNVRALYGDQGKAYSPHLYSAVVAGAGSGKGTLTWAKKLAMPIDSHLRKTSEEERDRWQSDRVKAQNEDIPFDDPEPPKRSLFLPANASASALHKRINAQHGRALLFETEIDTLVNALGQEWGKFDDTLRKAAHHETVSYLRNEEEAFIEEPRIAAVLSGTDDQFRRLIGSAENGLYSRFALYYHRRTTPWRSQRPTPSARKRREQFETWGKTMLKLYRLLTHRTDPLWITWSDGAWNQHTETFAPMKRRLMGEGLGHLESVIHRAGLTAYRISMVLSVLRHYEQNRDLEAAKSIEAGAKDVNAALELACLFADHALRFAKAKLDDGTPSDPQALRIRTLLRGVANSFSNADIYALAEEKGIDTSKRTLRRDLKTADSWGLIRSTKRSHWERVQ